VKPTYQFDDPRIATITNAADIFSNPDPNTIGTCGRNAFRGPAFRQWDFNINKTTTLSEKLNLQVRLEVFNVLNHPNFVTFPLSSNPNKDQFSQYGYTPDISSGNPFLSQGGSRAAQIGAKIIF